MSITAETTGACPPVTTYLPRAREFLARRAWYAYLIRLVLCWAGIVAIGAAVNWIVFLTLPLGDAETARRYMTVIRLAILFGTAVNICVVLVFVRWLFRHVDRRDVSELRMDLTARLPVLMVAGMVAALAMLAIIFAVQIQLGWITISKINWPPDNALLSVAFVTLVQFVSVGFLEEVRYRGYGYASGEGSLPRPVLIIFTAALFGLMHAQYGAFSVLAVASLMTIALFYIASLHLFGSIWFGVGFHFVWDFAQVSVFGLALASQQETQSLIDITQHGPALWVGGEALIEAGLTYLVAFAAAAMIVWGLWRRRGSAAAQH